MTEVAVKTSAPVARLGYRSPALRALSSAGMTGAGLAGIVGALGDSISASSQHTAFKLIAHSAAHFQYTSVSPAWDFAGALGPALLGGGGAALVSVGILQGMQALGKVGTVLKSAFGMGASITLVGIIAGAISYGGSIGSGQDQQAQDNWMQSQFHTSYKIPQPNKVYNDSQNRYEWYPAVFSGMDSANTEQFYSVSPVLQGGSGDNIGLDVKQITKAEAQKEQVAYTASLAQRNSSR